MEQFLLFNTTIGHRLVNVKNIIEVIPMVFLERDSADNDDNNFCGLMNFRGKIIPVFDFDSYKKDNCMDPSKFLIVAQHEKNELALLADELDYLVDVDQQDIEHVKPAQAKSFTVAKVNEEMLRVVNLDDFIKC